MNPSYLTTLTPLRGIAAVFVTLLHAQIFIYPLASDQATYFIANSWLWVDFFFILSGFILMHVYGDWFATGFDRSIYLKYIGARFARVYPLHLITMLWAFATGWLILSNFAESKEWQGFYDMIFGIKPLVTSTFMLQAMAMHETAPLNTPAWSLGTEWWMYVLFPLLVAPFLRLKKSMIVSALIIIAGSYLTLMYYVVPTFGSHMGQPMPQTINTINDFAMFRCIAGFTLGMVTFMLFRMRQGFSLLSKDYSFVLLSLGCIASLHFNIHELVTVCFFPLIILSAVYNSFGVKRFLDTKPLQRLGDWSFSIYMTHMPIIFVFKYVSAVMHYDIPAGILTTNPDYLIGWAYYVPFLALTLITAFAFYKWLEVPSRNTLNALFKTKSKPSALSTASA